MISIKASNGQYFDLSERASISLTIAPNNLGELNNRAGVTSYDFDLPLTAKNVTLLSEGTVNCTILLVDTVQSSLTRS